MTNRSLGCEILKPKLTKIRSISIVLMVLAAIFILIVVGVEAGKPFEQPARVGDSAPDFTLQTDSGKKGLLKASWIKGLQMLLEASQACDPYETVQDLLLLVSPTRYRLTSLTLIQKDQCAALD